ncbi:fimbrial protein [Serratia bockelmannii]|uniref:fimbrial protein n=1 Tax=Serratia bockelmannii TaxID=2703793 RepID=UPI003FA6FE1E
MSHFKRSAVMKFALGMGVIISAGFPLFSFANCNVGVTNTPMIARFLPIDAGQYNIGDTIGKANADSSDPGLVLASCDTEATEIIYIANGIEKVPGYSDLYKSQVPGIGFRVKRQDNGHYLTDYPGEEVTHAPPSEIKRDRRYEVELVVYDIIGSAPGNQLTVGHDDLRYFNGFDWQQRTLVDIRIGELYIMHPTCRIVDYNRQVRLGSVNREAFSGIGSTAKRTPFSISVVCPEEKKLMIAFNGTEDGDIRGQGVLATHSDGGQAGGLGIQLRHNGAPVPLNTPVQYSYVAGEAQSDISFSAEYYQTRANVTPGQVNASATFVASFE